MPCDAFSISRPMTSGMSFWTSCLRSQLVDSRWTTSNIFLRISRTWADWAYVVFLTWFGRRLVKPMVKMRTR